VLLKRRLRFGLVALLAFSLLLVLPDLLLAPEREGLLLRDWYDLVLVKVVPWSGGTPWAAGGKIWAPGGILNQSLSATLLRFLAATEVRIKGVSGLAETVRVNFVSLSPDLVKRLSYLAGLLLFAPILLAARRPWDRTPFRDLVRETALVGVLMLLLSPQTSKPHLVILLPAYAILLADALGPRHGRGSLALFALSFAAATLTVDGIVGRHLGDLFQACGAVTIGVLFVYAGLVRLRFRGDGGGPVRPEAVG
jgi:hypothetical protein